MIQNFWICPWFFFCGQKICSIELLRNWKSFYSLLLALLLLTLLIIITQPNNQYNESDIQKYTRLNVHVTIFDLSCLCQDGCSRCSLIVSHISLPLLPPSFYINVWPKIFRWTDHPSYQDHFSRENFVNQFLITQQLHKSDRRFFLLISFVQKSHRLTHKIKLNDSR